MGDGGKEIGGEVPVEVDGLGGGEGGIDGVHNIGRRREVVPQGLGHRADSVVELCQGGEVRRRGLGQIVHRLLRCGEVTEFRAEDIKINVRMGGEEGLHGQHIRLNGGHELGFDARDGEIGAHAALHQNLEVRLPALKVGQAQGFGTAGELAEILGELGIGGEEGLGEEGLVARLGGLLHCVG